MNNSWNGQAASPLTTQTESSPERSLHIVHIALQGCLKAGDISYGLTADTGGHIRYLLQQVQALRAVGVTQSVVTRAFYDLALGSEYYQPSETLMPGVALHRLNGASPVYLPKEELHGDLGALTLALTQWLRSRPRLPDMLHAHYADAGILALRMRERLGVPFLFTAHSLGAAKAQWLQSAPGGRRVGRALERRIAMEQQVIDHADAIVASSEHEARVQYGLYRQRENSRSITVNPPGSDLEIFFRPATRAARDRVAASLKVFLAEPEKPVLLCLARPVRKKNLIGVVDAYAHNAALRARANLVIFAGTRGDIADQEPECAEVLQALIDRMARYDLYGSMALPKHHQAGDVPAIYQHAARSGGLFINAAFNEPFGLTFIEAAAAGLPVIATRDGGARDILRQCKNGLLIDPYDEAAIARAAHRLLGDRQRWKQCANAGQSGVCLYHWKRHAEQYVRDCGALLGDPRLATLPAACLAPA